MTVVVYPRLGTIIYISLKPPTIIYILHVEDGVVFDTVEVFNIPHRDT